MRRTLVRGLLPLLFCIIPVLVAITIAVALEREAVSEYGTRLTNMDVIILSLGFSLFGFQIFLSWRALQWTGTGFNERPDPWLSHLAQATEWFPLMGLLGTVAGLLKTFSNFEETTPPGEVIKNFAPAITATGSGLFMALINIFPTWVVKVGRDLIQSLGGEEPIQGATIEENAPSGRSSARSSGTGRTTSAQRAARK